MRRRGGRGWRRLVPLFSGGIISGAVLAGCSVLTPLPKPTRLDQRLSVMPNGNLPLRDPVTIYWHDHQIPFIEAASDDDAAFVLGLVHAHLRLGQMAIYRRVARGRIAEMGGPLAVDLDRAIRILDFARATPAIDAALPDATRRWLQRFVDGVNHYQATTAVLPVEYRILGMQREARSRRVASSARASKGDRSTSSPSGVWPAPTSTGSSGSTCSSCAAVPTGRRCGRAWSTTAATAPSRRPRRARTRPPTWSICSPG